MERDIDTRQDAADLGYIQGRLKSLWDSLALARDECARAQATLDRLKGTRESTAFRASTAQTILRGKAQQ